MKVALAKIHLLAEEFFQYSLLTYLILLMAETLKPGFVNFFFNFNIVLIIVVLSGIIMVLTHNEHLEPKKTRKIKQADIELIIILALASGLLVYYRTSELGAVSFAITVITTVIILLIAVLLLTEE